MRILRRILSSHSVGIVRLWTQAMEFSLVILSRQKLALSSPNKRQSLGRYSSIAD
jgi:hypothetical protein